MRSGLFCRCMIRGWQRRCEVVVEGLFELGNNVLSGSEGGCCCRWWSLLGRGGLMKCGMGMVGCVGLCVLLLPRW